MTGFFNKIFGNKKKDEAKGSRPEELIRQLLEGIVEKSGLDLEFSLSSQQNDGTEEIHVQIFGVDENLLIEKEAQLLDSMQLLMKRTVQHQFPDAAVNIFVDCNGWREENNRSLIDLAERFRDRALEQGRSVYLKALPPKDRKVIHQFLANDTRVKSRSVGEGLYKKIKIFPVKESAHLNDVIDGASETL